MKVQKERYYETQMKSYKYRFQAEKMSYQSIEGRLFEVAKYA